MTKPGPDICVVIVTYFTGPSLWDCLASCQAQTASQIIIVNNGNSEKTATKLRDFQQNQPDIHLLEGHGNIGFAKACNLGAKAAKTKYLMF
ncbi:hypothetical protein MNBD_ALPHA06-809, partial [hydrothermal vent metagenome]